MNTEYVRLEQDGGLAILTLSRPAQRNTLSFEFFSELNAALDETVQAMESRLLLLRAEGRAFSAGMDLKAVALDVPAEAERFARSLADVYRRLLLLPIPLLVAVDGPALGGAMGLVLAADLIWAGPLARFAFPETRIGLVPALVSVVARRRLAPGKLMGLAIAGSESTGEEAFRLGLVDFVSTDSAAVDAEIHARKMMGENSAEAMRRTKAFLQSQFSAKLEGELEAAVTEFREAAATDACRRGVQAFREKRIPVWSE